MHVLRSPKMSLVRIEVVQAVKVHSLLFPREVPLRYLVGTLYVNFSMLWDPTIEVIR